MATRINTRFILILAGAVVLAAATIGGLLYLQIRANPERNIQAGDHLMEQGDYERALSMYGRAVHRQPANEGYRNKMKDALLRIQPETTEAADQFYREWLSLLSYEAQYDRTNPDAHLRLLREFEDFCRFSGSAELWRQLADHAENMWNRVPESEPDRIYAKLYRGMAMYQRVDANTERDNEAAEQDLKAFLEEKPESDKGWAQLIQGRLNRAQLHLSRSDNRAAEQLIEQADEAIEQATEQVEDGPALAIVRARRLHFQQARRNQSVPQQAWSEAADRIVNRIQGVDDGFLVGEAVDLLRVIDPDEGLDRAIDILNDYIEANDDAMLHEFGAARLHYATGNFDRTREIAESLIDREQLTVGLLARVQHHLRVEAASLLVDVEFRRWEQADSEDRPAIIEQLEEERDRLAGYATRREEDSIVIRADGKVAFAKGRYGEAAEHFEQLINRGMDENVEILRLSGIALEQEGQLGLARQRIEQALEQQPGNQWLEYQLARLLHQLREYDEALQAVDRALAAGPHEQAGELRVTIMQARSEGQGESDDPADVQAVLRRAYERFQSGDADGARALLHRGREHSPEHPDLVAALAELTMMTGELEAARNYVQEGLRLDPDNETFERFSRWLETDDPVHRVELVTEGQYDDDAERQAMTFVNLHRSAERWERQLGGGAGSNSGDELRDQIDRARQRAEAIRSEMDDEAADHPRMIEYLFERAIAGEDWSTAESLVARAKETDADGAEGLVYEGRYQMQRGQYVDAVRTFISLTERRGFSSQAWRLLGTAYHAVGNYADATRAFERAYEINPNDLLTLQDFGNMLLDSGDHQRAIELVRRARDLAPHSQTVRETWLELEARAGDPATALRERRKRYEENPDDRANALRLAELLVTTQPDRPMILNEDGRPRFESRNWDAMPQSRRQEIVQETKQQWYRDASSIIDGLIEAGHDDIQVVAMKSRLLGRTGQPSEGAALLEEEIEQREGREKIDAVLALSEFHVEANRLQQALRVLDDAREDQADTQRRIDRRIADLLMARYRAFEQAAGLYRNVLNVNDDRAVRMRMTECLIQIGQFDAAESQIDQMVEQTGEDMELTLLMASLAGERAAAAREQGETRRASELRADQRELLSTAEQMNPASAAPHIRKALSYFEEYQHTGGQRLIDEAELSLSRAENLNPDQIQSRMIRSEIRANRGDIAAAARELDQVVALRPDHDQARRRLIQHRLELGEADRAIGVVRDAIDRNPNQAGLHDQLGELLMRAGRHDEAVQAFRRSLELQPNDAKLAKLAESMLRKPSPDYNGVRSLLGRAIGAENVNPTVRILLAEASAGLGRMEEAREQLRLAYGRFRKVIDERDNLDVRSLSTWYATLRRIYVPDQTQQADEFVLELTGDDPDAFDLDQLAELWARTPGGLDRAMELQQLAVEKLDSVAEVVRPRIVHRQGMYLYRAEEYSAAMQAFRRQVEMTPSDHSALNNLAYVLAKYLDQAEEALTHARRAVELQPDNASYHDTLGMIYTMLGQFDDARAALRRAIELDGQMAMAHVHMAQLHLAEGDPERAGPYLEQAAELNPDDDVQREMDEAAERINQARN